MMNHLESAWLMLNDPARVGGALDQFPATAGIVGLLLVLLLLATGGRSHALRFAGAIVLGLGAAAAATPLPAVAEEQPAWLAHLEWVALAVPAGLLLVSAIPKPPIRIVALVLAMLTSVAASGVVGYAMAMAGHAAPEPTTESTDSASPSDNPSTGAEPAAPARAPERPTDEQPQEESIFEFGRDQTAR